MPEHCRLCGAGHEDLLFQAHWGDWMCGACAASCVCCDTAAAVVSARRPSTDPVAPGQIDHVCVNCLVDNWY